MIFSAAFLKTFEDPLYRTQRNPKFYVYRWSIVQMLQRAETSRWHKMQPRGVTSLVCVSPIRKKRDRTKRERETEKEFSRDKLAHERTTCIQCMWNLWNPTRKLTSKKSPSVYRSFSRVSTANQEPGVSIVTLKPYLLRCWTVST